MKQRLQKLATKIGWALIDWGDFISASPSPSPPSRSGSPSYSNSGSPSPSPSEEITQDFENPPSIGRLAGDSPTTTGL